MKTGFGPTILPGGNYFDIDGMPDGGGEAVDVVLEVAIKGTLTFPAYLDVITNDPQAATNEEENGENYLAVILAIAALSLDLYLAAVFLCKGPLALAALSTAL